MFWSTHYNDSNIISRDDDGDGYYTWGIGDRPLSVPEWAPNQQDGDDSDYSKGPVNRYGFLKDNNPDNKDTIFVEADRRADYQLTLSIRHILENNANKDDIVALFSDKNLPVDDITAEKLAEEVLANSPKQGYLIRQKLKLTNSSRVLRI